MFIDTTTPIGQATKTVFDRCDGDHTIECAWHAVMAVDENHAESGFDYEPEYVENALAMIDNGCCCK
jgi:hypothetical protein